MLYNSQFINHSTHHCTTPCILTTGMWWTPDYAPVSMRFSLFWGLLCCVEWQFLTEVSGQHTDLRREHAVAQLVEALRYKPEGRGFDSRWYHWNFSLTQSFRPLTEMSTRNISLGVGGKGGRCVGLTFTTSMCRMSWNLGASTSWNPEVLSRPVMRLLYLHLPTARPFCGA